MPTALLPDQFRELEGYAGKRCHPGEGERGAEHPARSVGEIQRFYDGLEPRAAHVSCILEPAL